MPCVPTPGADVRKRGGENRCRRARGSNAAKRQTLRGRWCVAISEILVHAVRRCIKYVHEFSEGMLGPFPWAVAMARADSTLRQLLIDYTRCPNYAIWWERECAC